MAKRNSAYICNSCGAQSPKWQGRCPDCGEWNSFSEERLPLSASQDKDGRRRSLAEEGVKSPSPQPVSDIEVEHIIRVQSGIGEFDRVLGGGIVPGSLTLIGGDPGIGKSTLSLQASGELAKTGAVVLYVSGEESASQIKMRAERLGITSEKLYLFAENDCDRIIAEIKRLKPFFVVIDSVQTVYSPLLQSIPGSITQVRDAASQFMYLAKSTGISILLIGHVNKEGSIAGPKVLEHIVDTVLSFEGERGNSFRIVRAIKNRFGSTNELGIFEMKQEGICEVLNPSELFISGVSENVSGYALTVTMEGTRPFLIEVQALISNFSGFGSPRRMANGIEQNRLAIIIAILEKRAGMQLATQDVYLNVAGGVKLTETAVDLAVTAAMISSIRNIPLPASTIFIGEVGLAGEVRGVSQTEQRLNEAVKLGYTKAVIPAQTGKNTISRPEGMDVTEVENIEALISGL